MKANASNDVLQMPRATVEEILTVLQSRLNADMEITARVVTGRDRVDLCVVTEGSPESEWPSLLEPVALAMAYTVAGNHAFHIG